MIAKPRLGGARAQRLVPLVADAFGADASIGVERGSNRRGRRRLELELERRDEARRAQHAQPVFGEALGRIAHRAQHAAAQIVEAAEGIDQRAPSRGSKAIALTVKSRRARSSSMIVTKST